MNSRVQVDLSPQTGKGMKRELISSCWCASVTAACFVQIDYGAAVDIKDTGLFLPSKYICAHDCDHNFVMGWLNWFDGRDRWSLVSMCQLGKGIQS